MNYKNMKIAVLFFVGIVAYCSVLAQTSDHDKRIEQAKTENNLNVEVMKQALVIIDIQNDYFQGGKFPLHNPTKAAEKAHLVLEQCRAIGIPVIHVQHVNPQGAPFFEPNTAGVEIHPLVKPKPGETIVVKHYPNSFRDTTLKAELDRLGVEKLIIIGMMTHMCIDTTTRAARDLGYDCTVVADCCATRSLEYNSQIADAESVQVAYLGALNGYFAKVVDSKDLEF